MYNNASQTCSGAVRKEVGIQFINVVLPSKELIVPDAILERAEWKRNLGCGGVCCGGLKKLEDNLISVLSSLTSLFRSL
jgi:hypothetical protein